MQVSPPRWKRRILSRNRRICDERGCCEGTRKINRRVAASPPSPNAMLGPRPKTHPCAFAGPGTRSGEAHHRANGCDSECAVRTRRERKPPPEMPQGRSDRKPTVAIADSDSAEETHRRSSTPAGSPEHAPRSRKRELLRRPSRQRRHRAAGQRAWWSTRATCRRESGERFDEQLLSAVGKHGRRK